MKLKELLKITEEETPITLGIGDMVHENIKEMPEWAMNYEVESISLYDDGWKQLLEDSSFPTTHSIFIELKL